MLVYFENTQGNTQGNNIKSEETLKEFSRIVEEVWNIKKVLINMIQNSCICNNNLTDIFLEYISKDINLGIIFWKLVYW